MLVVVYMLNNIIFLLSDTKVQLRMPTSKEVLAQRWLQKTEEEKEQIRKKNAERIRTLRAKKGQKKRSEMNSEELAKIRAKDRYNKSQRRKKMTEDQNEEVRTTERERIARRRKQSKENVNMKQESDGKQKKQTDLQKLGKKKMKQLANNCRIQRKLETKRSEKEKENIQAEKVEKMREKRKLMTPNGEMLARIHARMGMRDWRRYGYLREYKQRKIRNSFNPSLWKKEPHAISEYFGKVKEVETKEERKEELRRMNRIRVARHRMKVKRMLQEPIIIDNYGQKGAYELLREKNIEEFEKLKKESGLF